MHRLYMIGLMSFCLINCQKQTKLEKEYDEKTQQKPIYTHQALEQVLQGFPLLGYQQLNKDYVKRCGLDNSIYYHRQFYVIKGENVFKYLVGKFRVADFMPKDEFFSQNLANLKANQTQYLLLDKRVLYKFLDLMIALEKKNYQKDAFKINDGFRYPVYNQQVGGAKGSLHTWGMAIDVDVLDIDKNGKIEKADKKIVLDLLENQIIAQQGGVGRYPWSQTVHFDVRGWYARWDKQ